MLTSKEKRYLKSQAHHLKAIFQIGKEGLNSNQVGSLNDALEAHELIKISLLKTCPSDDREVALDLARFLKAEIVQIIGHTIILYRQSSKKLINLKEI